MKPVLVFLTFCFSQYIFSQDSLGIRIQNAIDLFAKNSSFSNASITFKVIDCADGKELASYNPLVSLQPASVTKLFSTAAAFHQLGGDYTPETRVYFDGWISKDSILHGNIWIRGAGDPSLGSKYYNASGSETTFLQSWADSILKKGIKKITGAIIGDASEFGYQGIPDGWAWGDMGNYYGAGPSGLGLYDNVLRMYFSSPKTAGQKTKLLRTFPVIPNFNFENGIVAGGSGDNSFIYGAPFSYNYFGTGRIQIKQSSMMVRGTLPDPELCFAQEFSRILKSKGIVVSDSVLQVRTMPKTTAIARYSSKKILFTYKGRSLASVAWWTNMKSVNYFAESILCWTGYEKNGDGSTDNSTDQMMAFWRQKINTKGLYLNDGSGLSRSNAINANHFCEMLRFMKDGKAGEEFYKTLAVSGVSGTLESVCKNQAAQGKLHAKSGTIKRVKSYAGYAETNKGRKLAFAIIVNNFTCSSDEVVLKMEKVFNVLIQE